MKKLDKIKNKIETYYENNKESVNYWTGYCVGVTFSAIGAYLGIKVAEAIDNKLWDIKEQEFEAIDDRALTLRNRTGEFGYCIPGDLANED